MGLIVNEDFMVFVLREEKREPPKTREEALSRIDRYVAAFAGTGVERIYFNPNAQLSYSKSDVWEYALHRYRRTEVDGIPFSARGSYLDSWFHYEITLGVDIIGEMISAARRYGIFAGLTFRVNDVHDSMTPTGELRGSDFTHEARKNGLVRCRHRDLCDYYDNALDFAIPEVRERLLAYIAEQTGRYAPDGVELDFMREPYCFRPGFEEEGREIIRRFVREVKGTVGDVSLSLRTFRDVTSDFYSGIDAVGLAREGLLDLVVPTPRWETSDSHIPVDLWRNILPPEARLAAGTDVNHQGTGESFRYYTDGELYGMANAYLTQGADYVYLFNFSYRKPGAEDEHEILRFAGSLDTLKDRPRKNKVTYQDVAAIGESPSHPLPLSLSDGGHSYLRIPTGRTDGPLYLLLSGEEGDLEVFVNSAPVSYLGKRNGLLCFEIQEIRPCHQMIELRARGGGRVLTRAEITNYDPQKETP